MNRIASLLSVSLLALSACAIDDAADTSSVDQAETGEQGLNGAPEPHQMHQKDAHGPGGTTTKDTLLHNKSSGNVMSAPHTKAIFWGSQWNGSTGTYPDKRAGMNRFFDGIGGSSFANTNIEYAGFNGLFASNQIAYDGEWVDTAAAPTKALSVTAAVNEACKMAAAKGVAPDPNTVYFIFTATGAGHVSYCAWHSAGSCSNGTTVQVAYMPNNDGIGGCDPGDTTTGHTPALASLANVTAHELSEAITDPHLDAYQDSSGQENADKCAWHWGPDVTFSPGTAQAENWKLQMNFSNAAYTASRSDDLASTPLRGCIQTN